MKTRKVGQVIKTLFDGHWEWFLGSDALPYAITGKYLFFSADRGLLVKIVLEELESGSTFINPRFHG